MKIFLAYVDRLVEWAQKTARIFQRLQWKLTFLYTIITVGMLTLVLGVSLYFANSLYFTSSQVGFMLPIAMTDSTAELAPDLAAQPPRTAALQTWVSRTLKGSTLLIRRSGAGSEGFTFTSMASPNTLLLIVDPEGRVVASNHPEQAAEGASLPDEFPQTGKTLIGRALSGETDPMMLFTPEKNQLLAAAPVRSQPGAPIAGAVFIRLARPNPFELVMFTLQATIGNVLVMTLAAGLIGMIFGLLTARGLARRLKAVAEAATAWGHGDFSRRLNDRHEDEIGMLAHEMNKVAGQLENLMQTRQELAAVEERNRLARDLHDSVKQQVFAATMNLGAAQALWERDPQEAYRRVESAAALARQSQKELSLLIQTLRPVQLEQNGLANALREHLTIWERNSGITVQAELPETLAEIPAEVQEAIYRICQEAFANIARHSGAKAASLNIEVSETAAAVLITDNGRGFDAGQPAPGLGLRSMLERSNALGGTLQVESDSTGTRIRATLPMNRQNRRS